MLTLTLGRGLRNGFFKQLFVLHHKNPALVGFLRAMMITTTRAVDMIKTTTAPEIGPASAKKSSKK